MSIHQYSGLVDGLGVGMFPQTLLLALTPRGLGACVQVSIAGYPDPDFPANNLRIGRDSDR